MTSSERKFEYLTELLEKLCLEGDKGVPLLVEGKKDSVALRKLGFTGKIICVKNSSKVLVDLLDDVQSNEVALFVDFDESGIALAKSITQYLEGRDVKVNSTFWRRTHSFVRKDLSEIEGLPSYLEKLKKRVAHFRATER